MSKEDKRDTLVKRWTERCDDRVTQLVEARARGLGAAGTAPWLLHRHDIKLWRQLPVPVGGCSGAGMRE